MVSLDEIQSGLISPNGTKIDIPYYKIGEESSNIVSNFCLKDINTANEFNSFAKNYSYFKPEFDFLIHKLGYKLANPLLSEEDFDNYSLAPMDDYNLKIRGYDFDVRIKNYDNCFIDKNGFLLCLDNMDYVLNCHNTLAGNILNQLMIYDKDLFDLYSKIFLKRRSENRDTFDMYATILYAKLGYLRIALNDEIDYYVTLLYNSSLTSEIQSQIIDNMIASKSLSRQDIHDLNIERIRKRYDSKH